ncbi:MAG TPA: glycosyltransferase 87 family protein [Geobacteraceae bacterium]|nr:glycosyltransferase 87 family protein [Geobacteraceae bacterium]
MKKVFADKVTPFVFLLVIVSSCLMLAVQPELRLVVPLIIGVTAIMVITLTLALYRGERGEVSWSPSVILGVALFLRLMFLFSPPQLSDDVYRYLWDGRQVLGGESPYAAAPAAVQPQPELAEVHSRINHPDYVTLYPPAAQLVFAGGAAMGCGITGLKAFLVLFDLGLCALLMVALGRLGMPRWRAVLYAWNPLPVLEIAGSGHVDGAGLTMLMGVFCLLLTERNSAPSAPPRKWPFILAGALLACSALVKLFPLVLAPVPFLLAPSRRRIHFVAAFLGTLALLLVPFLPHLYNMAATLDIYARKWEFAGFAFTTLRKMTGSGELARMLVSGGFLAAAAWIFLRLAHRLKEHLSVAARGRLAMEACYSLAMAMLLLTPTLQPWYALSLAVFLPFCAGPAGIVLCWAVFLTYRVQIPYFTLGQWIENPLVTAAVFLAPVTTWLFSGLLREYRTARGDTVSLLP